MKHSLVVLTILGALVITAADTGTDLYQRALVRERSEGKLADAIQLYEKIVKEHGKDRTLAAKALLRMAECQEKLGQQEARKTYERLVREFSDHTESTAARTRLAVLAGDRQTAGISTRKVWSSAGIDICATPIDPTGRYLAYIDSDDLVMLRETSTGATHRLTQRAPGSTEWADFPVFSPDGKYVAYEWNLGRRLGDSLRIAGVDGSAPRTVWSGPGTWMRPESWSRDGKYILAVISAFSAREERIVLITIADGKEKLLKTVPMTSARSMTLSPDGKFVAYDAPDKGGSAEYDIYLLEVPAGEETARERPLIQHAAHDRVLGWTPDGGALLFSSDRGGSVAIWAQKLSGGRAEGEPRLLRTEGSGRVDGLGFTNDGTFHYNNEDGVRDVYVVDLDPVTGKVRGNPRSTMRKHPAKSPVAVWTSDGQHLVYAPVDPKGPVRTTSMLIVKNVATGEERTLMPGIVIQQNSLLAAPDGRIQLNGADRSGRQGSFLVDLRTGDATHVGRNAFGISGDGNFLYYVDASDLKHVRIMRRDLKTGSEQEIRKLEHQLIRQIRYSVSENAIATEERNPETERRRIVLHSLNGGEPKVLVEAGSAPRSLEFGPDRHLYYVAMIKGKHELYRVPLAGGAPQALGLSAERMTNISIHPNGKSLVYTAGEFRETVWAMQGYQQELR